MQQADFEQFLQELNPQELSPPQVYALMQVTTAAIAHLAQTEQLMQLALTNRQSRLNTHQ